MGLLLASFDPLPQPCPAPKPFSKVLWEDSRSHSFSSAANQTSLHPLSRLNNTNKMPANIKYFLFQFKTGCTSFLLSRGLKTVRENKKKYLSLPYCLPTIQLHSSSRLPSVQEALSKSTIVLKYFVTCEQNTHHEDFYCACN